MNKEECLQIFLIIQLHVNFVCSIYSVKVVHVNYDQLQPLILYSESLCMQHLAQPHRHSTEGLHRTLFYHHI
jgi:hypothetical protein